MKSGRSRRRNQPVVDHIIGLGRDVFDVLACGHEMVCICGEAERLRLRVTTRLCQECGR